MPSITQNIQQMVAVGPVVEVVFGPTHAGLQAMQTAGQKIPGPIKAVAMVDTGASTTVVTPEIAKHLGLHPVGQIMMMTPTTQEPVPSNQYCVDLHFAANNSFAVRNVVVCEAGMVGQHIQCLLGRDVLRHGVLIYIGYNNQFTLSF